MYKKHFYLKIFLKCWPLKIELQKQLREERAAREELANDYDQFREEMGDSAETIEMMTLDKEMAEEQAEILKVWGVNFIISLVYKYELFSERFCT